MLVAVGALAALSFLLATLLVVAHKKLHVDEDLGQIVKDDG